MMKTYAKPMILANDELAEGVYAASGGNTSGDCWTVSASSEQEWNGAEHVFEVKAVHGSGEHISGEQAFKLVFSDTIVGARTELGTCTFSGNTVTIKTSRHGNAYGSGDESTFKVWVKAGDEAKTKAIACTGAAGTYCDHQTNVQGGVD